MSEGHKPTSGMIAEAKKGLAWRKEFGRGGTLIGVARARDIVNEKNLSLNTVKRMKSFFARHAVDKKAEGYRPGEKGYPSNGRIANALWGGDAGKTWANKIVEQANNEEKERMEAKDLATRHVLEVEETENEYIVAFAKAKAEEVAEEPEMEMAEEERKASIAEPLSFRTGEVERGWSYDKEKDDRRVRLAWASQSPVEREFGYEVLGHSEDEIDLSFARSGRMPLLLDHDMRQQIGVVENVSLDSLAGIARATVRFGKGALAD
jgi:hypothetical protein